MSSIRTIDQLEAALTEDLKWRRHEMDQWERAVSRAREHERPGLLRGGTALIYAHWEGYVKFAASTYLEYVSNKRLKLADLRDELAAVALRGMLGKGEQSKQAEAHTEIVSTLRQQNRIPADLPFKQSTIRTRANLNFKTFADIMHSIGCDSSRHEIYSMTIDARLLRHRNEIAHGKEEYVELQDWRDIKTRIVDILIDVRAQITNSASLAEYRSNPQGKVSN